MHYPVNLHVDAACRTPAAPDTASTFVAIDFETASTRRDSACAVGVAACYAGRVVLSRTYLIRPPSSQFTFTDLHGLRWEDVRDAATFAELWPTLRAWIAGAAFVAAHNAPFDRSVLHASCARYRLRPPPTRFVCTVQLARAQWGIRPTKLPDVCRWLSIPLRHHDAGADAVACARIVLAAKADGWRPEQRRTRRTHTLAIGPRRANRRPRCVAERPLVRLEAPDVGRPVDGAGAAPDRRSGSG